MLTTTPIALVIFAAILFAGPVRGVVLLAAVMPFGSSAAFALGQAGTVSLLDFSILAMWLSLVGRTGFTAAIVQSARPHQAGFPLLLLIILAGLGALFLPQILSHRTDVFVTVQMRDYATIALTPLEPTSTVTIQFLRFMVASSIFFLLAGVFARKPRADLALKALITATSLHIVLSVADIASYALGFPDLLDPIRTMRAAMLDNQYLGGIKRVSGGFPEPSAYAYFTMALFGFWLRMTMVKSLGVWPKLFAIAMFVLLIRSTSSAAYLGLTLFSVAFVAVHLKTISHLKPAARLILLSAAFLPVMAGASVALYSLNAEVAHVIDAVLIDKVSSDSATERMSWNNQALTNLKDTIGLGTGMGAGRASGWLFACLGGLGIAGTALYLWFVARVIFARQVTDTLNTNVSAALKTGCAALIIQAALTKPYPNLEAVFFILAGLAVALGRAGSQHVAAEVRRPA